MFEYFIIPSESFKISSIQIFASRGPTNKPHGGGKPSIRKISRVSIGRERSTNLKKNSYRARKLQYKTLYGEPRSFGPPIDRPYWRFVAISHEVRGKWTRKIKNKKNIIYIYAYVCIKERKIDASCGFNGTTAWDMQSSNKI